MDQQERSISRHVLTDFCRALGYDPNEVITINAEAETVAVTTMPRGVSGVLGVTTVHQIGDLSGEEV